MWVNGEVVSDRAKVGWNGVIQHHMMAIGNLGMLMVMASLLTVLGTDIKVNSDCQWPMDMAHIQTQWEPSMKGSGALICSMVKE